MPTPDELKEALRSLDGATVVSPEQITSRARRRRNAKLAGVSGSAVLAVGALAVFALPTFGGLGVNSSADSTQFNAGAGQPPMNESESQSGTNSKAQDSEIAAGTFDCGAKAELAQSTPIPVDLELSALSALPPSGGAIDIEFRLTSRDESIRTVSALPMEMAVVDDSDTIVGQLVPVTASGEAPGAATLDLAVGAPQPLSVQFRYYQCAGVDPTAQSSYLPMLEISTSITEPSYAIVFGTRVLNQP